MADDRKRTELISVKVTERMYIDLGRSAAARDRSVSDAIYVAMRHYLYGNIARLDRNAQLTSSDDVNQGHEDA